MTGTWQKRPMTPAKWHVWCMYNLPFIDTMQWYLPAIAFCWMPGFRGFKLFFLCFEWSLGIHYCDEMSHDVR